MENLSKKFWDELGEKYPEAALLFRTWLDEYKSQIEWSRIFNSSITGFDQLPFEMQNGILARYDCEMREIKYEDAAQSYHKSIEVTFRTTQQKIVGKKKYFEDKLNREQGN